VALIGKTVTSIYPGEAAQKVVAAEAPRRGNGAADNNPLAARRFAPGSQRMERTSVEASKFAPPSSAHPQPRYIYYWIFLLIF